MKVASARTRTVVTVTAFVAEIGEIPMRRDPGQNAYWVRPDQIEVRYERVDLGEQGEMIFSSAAVSGKKVDTAGNVVSLSGTVLFTDDTAPGWVNRFVLDHMPRPVSPAMLAMDKAYELTGQAGNPDSPEARPVADIVAAMPEGMAYRVKGAALLLSAVADSQWRQQMGDAFTNREGSS